MNDKHIYWYVLFVKTGSEEKIVGLLKERLDEENFLPFLLTKECIYRRHGNKTKYRQICFRGYVFVQSSKPPEEFRMTVFSIVYRINNVYKFLNYGDRTDIAMHESERIAFAKIFGEEFCLRGSIALGEGDKIRIVNGPLVDNESFIKKINRKRKEAVIEIEMFQSKIEINVGLEFIEKL